MCGVRRWRGIVAKKWESIKEEEEEFGLQVNQKEASTCKSKTKGLIISKYKFNQTRKL